MDAKQDNNAMLKKNLLEVFYFVIKFLDAHNLRYWATGGTCIGAVRHKGFIPWDDDIDIRMPIEDYKKLLNLRDELQGSRYKLIAPGDQNYYYDFIKIVDTNTTIWEYEERPFVMGVFVDIFPCHPTNISNETFRENTIKYNKLFYRYSRTIVQMNGDHLFQALRAKQYIHLISYFRTKLLFRNSTRYYNEYIDFLRTLDDSTGKRYACYEGGVPSQFIYEREWFDELIDAPFENLTIKIPSKYHLFLSSIFGDYMELPAEEKRISIHGKAYINLKEGLNLDEVKERVKKGEREVY